MPILLSLGITFAIALLSTRFVKLLRLPNVTGYLLTGLIVGPYLLNIINQKELSALEALTSLALGFIAFSIGGEFKISNIKKIGGKIFLITLFQSSLACILVDIGLIAIGAPISLAITLGAIATATAPAATLMVIRQYKARGPVTETLLPVVALDDAIGLMIFSISFALAKVIEDGDKITITNAFLLPMLEIIASLVIGVVLGFLLSFAMKFFKSHANRLSLMIAAVFLGVGLCEFIPFSLSSLLVCMMLGTTFTNVRNDSIIILDGAEKWTPPLFLLFFVLSGAELDFKVIPTVGLIGIVYLVCRSLGKYFGSYFGAVITKADKNVKKYLGFALLPQAGVAIGMAQMVSINMSGEIGSKITAVVLCATLIYELFGPVITKIALSKAGEIPQKNKVEIK